MRWLQPRRIDAQHLRQKHEDTVVNDECEDAHDAELHQLFE